MELVDLLTADLIAGNALVHDAPRKRQVVVSLSGMLNAILHDFIKNSMRVGAVADDAAEHLLEVRHQVVMIREEIHV